MPFDVRLRNRRGWIEHSEGVLKWKTPKWKSIHCPISAVLRACKYAKKGYSMRSMEVLQLFDNWDERPDEYKERLRERYNTLR